MELCGAGCMGFANVEPRPAGDGLRRARPAARRAGRAGDALGLGVLRAAARPPRVRLHARGLLRPGTRHGGAVLPGVRAGAAGDARCSPWSSRRCGSRTAAGTCSPAAAATRSPVVLLTAGNSASGRAMVAAHSGALAGSDGGWEALARAYGVHRVSDLAEMADTLELFALRATRRDGHRGAWPSPGLAMPAAASRPCTTPASSARTPPTSPTSSACRSRRSATATKSAPGGPARSWPAPDEPARRLGNRRRHPGAVRRLAGRARAGRVRRRRGARRRPRSPNSTATPRTSSPCSTPRDRTDKPVAVLSNLASAIDHGHGRPAALAAASRCSRACAPACWRCGTCSTSEAAAGAAEPGRPGPDQARQDRARKLLAESGRPAPRSSALLREYGIAAARAERAGRCRRGRWPPPREIGYPVVLKTDEPAIAHKSDAGGVVLGIADARRAGRRLCRPGGQARPRGPGLRDRPARHRAGARPRPRSRPRPADRGRRGRDPGRADRRPGRRAPAGIAGPGFRAAGRAEGRPRCWPAPAARAPADLGAIVRAITGLAELASELGEDIDALDINPLICGPHGAIAVDALVDQEQRKIS